jgi:hypothetical protein
VGELPLAMQGKLLRVLEAGEVHRVSSLEPRRVDVHLSRVVKHTPDGCPDAHHIERASMSSPLAAVRLSIVSDGSSSTVEPSVDTSSLWRRHLSWMASA